MEKRAAQVKIAGQELRTAIKFAQTEYAENLLIAGDNRSVFFTGEGESQPYNTTKFRNMIKLADELVGVALQAE